MLYRIFSQILSMSLTGSIVILFVLLARQLLRRTPRIFSYLLWGIVLFRLLCPVVPSSALSLMNLVPDSMYALRSEMDQAFQPPAEYIVDSGITTPILPSVSDKVLESDVTTESIPYVIYDIYDVPADQASPRINAFRGATILWLAGTVTLLTCSLHSLWKLRHQLNTAVPLRKNIYLADYITTPFVLGLLRPRIYLPSSLSEEQQSHILLHESHHIRRLDHLWKLAAFIVLCLHWFNPLVWLAFVLAGKDMEMSCDEAVLRRMGKDICADYSASLLTLSTGQRIYSAMPLAFGEGDTKDRIHHVLAWKKPRTWIVVAATLACLALIVCLSTDVKSQPDFFGARYSVKEILYDAPQYGFTYTVDTSPEFTITSDHVLLWREPSSQQNQWNTVNGLYKVDYSRQELYALFDPLNCTAHEKLDQVKVIYRAEPFNVSASIFYLVMQTKNGNILLAQGYGKETDENQHVRWLFQLEQQSGAYELDRMSQILKDNYGESAEYFSLYQCDTTPDTILLGFQVGTENAKAPSSVGYAVFHYNKTSSDYLLTHSEILKYDVTGLYPIKLMPKNGHDTHLQIVLSTRDDVIAVRIASNRPETKNFQMEKAIVSTSGSPAMYVFECPDELTLKTLQIDYIYEDSRDDELIVVPEFSPLRFYLVSEDDKDLSFAIPALTLGSGHRFQFAYDMLSSYVSLGFYNIRDNILTAITDDGRFQYCFEIIDGNTLRFLQDESSDVSLIDERLGIPITDRALFTTK